MRLQSYEEKPGLVRLTVELDDGRVRDLEVTPDDERAGDVDVKVFKPEEER